MQFELPGGFSERKRLRSIPLELDAVLNCCHGGPGEDGSLAALLALAGIRVTGPGPQASALAMDKVAAMSLASIAEVPVIPTALVVDGRCVSGKLPPTPWVAKPRFGGSSIGVESGVSDMETVQALGRTGVGRAGMVVQPYLSGWHDLNISVRTYPAVELSVIERPLRADNAIYGYREKYLSGSGGMDASERELPAVIPPPVEEKIRDFARRIADAFDLTGAPRIDFLWDGEESVVFCEANSVPGAWGNHLWVANGLERAAFYRDLVEEALTTPASPPQWSGSSDGQALRVAGSISSKLA